MKKQVLLLAALSMLSSGLKAGQLSPATDIDDLALIYIGSQNRPEWTKEKFLPYVVHTYPDRTQSWKFDGFLFLDYMMYDENGTTVSLGEFDGNPSRRSHWERLLDIQFGQDKGSGLSALDELIGELTPSLGQPGHKHKIVFNAPVPDKPSQIWGSLYGESINISTDAGKIKTMKWYADEFIKRWEKAGFKNIELDGIYWTKESFFEDYWNTVIPEVNNYFHSLGLKVYWIPYYGARGADRWKEWGMDVCYIQPGYYFKKETPLERLTDAINYAWDNDVYLEMEFEGLDYNYIPNSDITYTTIAPNSGLHAHHPEFYQRLVDYIDYFETEQVFEYMPVAYYNGRQAVFDFCNSKDPKDQEVMNRLALIINKRHIDTGWDTEPRTTGFDDAVIADFEIAYAVDGGIYITDGSGGNVTVHSADGRLIYNRSSAEADIQRLRYGLTASCRPGVYIVRSGACSVKVAVR